MGGPLVFHRLIFILLNLLLAYKIRKRIVFELENSEQDGIKKKNEVNWNDVNLLEPSRLFHAMAERMRLNELLAVKNYDCKEKLRFGDDYEKYFLCGEFGSFKSAASISGDKDATGDLEKEISAKSWIIFTPEGSTVVDKLKGDVEVNYFTELEEWDHWHTWDLEQVLKNRHLDVAKFELYSPHFHSQDQPNVLRKLVPLMRAKQLLITIEPGDTDEIVWKWYSLLYWLFFEHNYAIIGAIPNGVCGQNPRRCRYRVSLAKTSEEKMKSAPVFGMGSPLEEKRRLMKFIGDAKAPCKVFPSNSKNQKYCLWNIQPAETVVFVKYSEWSKKELPSEFEILKRIFLVSPFSSNDSTGVTHLPWILSSLNSTENNQWALKKLDDVLQAVGGSIDLLLLDIDGAEWELFPQLINASVKINQISIRGRIFPEENENYRKFYWQLYRLTKLGYQTKLGRVVEPFYEIVLKKR